MVSTNKLIVLLTIPVTIASVVIIITSLASTGFLGDLVTISEVAPVGEIPFGGEMGAEDITEIDIQLTTEELISQFLGAIGAKVTETFAIETEVQLIDANQEAQISSSRLIVQPLDPQDVIIPVDEELSTKRFFINTDFSTQIADNGRNYHQFSSWDLVRNGNVAINVFPVTKCDPFVPFAKLCIRVEGRGVEKESPQFGGLYGLSKEIDISDWTREGDLTVSIDYGMNTGFQKFSRYLATVCGDTCQTYFLPVTTTGQFEENVQHLLTDPASNTLTVQFGAQIFGDPDEFRISSYFNNAQVEGNSVLKREAISILQSLTIVENQDEGRILDLGFLAITMKGLSILDLENVVLNAVLETRIDDKTISTHALTSTGTTFGNEIPIKIDGRDSLILSLDDQSFTDDEFHNFKLVVRDVVVNLGEGEDTRTFENHRSFVAYLLEFEIDQDQIVAFNTEGRAIEVFKSDSTLRICGQTSGTVDEPEVIPPEVRIIDNGFTIAISKEGAGKTPPDESGTNREFCQTIPELPRQVTLTFKVDDLFFEVQSPITQKLWTLDCNRISSTQATCTSNFGYSETIDIT